LREVVFFAIFSVLFPKVVHHRAENATRIFIRTNDDCNFQPRWPEIAPHESQPLAKRIYTTRDFASRNTDRCLALVDVAAFRSRTAEIPSRSAGATQKKTTLASQTPDAKPNHELRFVISHVFRLRR
jgi:hypothetical protein